MDANQPDVKDIEAAIKELLVEVEVGALSTVAPDGAPHTSTMHFAGDGLAVYCHTFTYTRKYAHLQHDPRVSYALAYMSPDGFYGRHQARSLQVSGNARLVTDQAENQHAIEVSREQFDWLKDADIFAAFQDPSPHMRNVFFRIEPEHGLWSDNRVRMMYRALVEFGSDPASVKGLQPYGLASQNAQVPQGA